MTLWVGVEIIGSIATRDIPIPQLVWLRYVFHLLLMLIVVVPRAGSGFVRTRRPVLHVARSLLMVVMPGSFILGVRSMSMTQVMGIFWIAPLLVLLFARLIGERASSTTWLAVMTAWIGALGLYRPDIAAIGWAAIYPLSMAASFALYIVLTRVLDRTEGVATNLFYSAAGVAVVVAPVMLLIWRQPTLRALVASLTVGVVGYVVLWSLDLAVRMWRAPRTAVFLFSQILVAKFLSAALALDFNSKSLWLGTALICAAMYAEARSDDSQRMLETASPRDTMGQTGIGPPGDF